MAAGIANGIRWMTEKRKGEWFGQIWPRGAASGRYIGLAMGRLIKPCPSIVEALADAGAEVTWRGEAIENGTALASRQCVLLAEKWDRVVRD